MAGNQSPIDLTGESPEVQCVQPSYPTPAAAATPRTIYFDDDDDDDDVCFVDAKGPHFQHGGQTAHRGTPGTSVFQNVPPPTRILPSQHPLPNANTNPNINANHLNQLHPMSSVMTPNLAQQHPSIISANAYYMHNPALATTTNTITAHVPFGHDPNPNKVFGQPSHIGNTTHAVPSQFHPHHALQVGIESNSGAPAPFPTRSAYDARYATGSSSTCASTMQIESQQVDHVARLNSIQTDATEEAPTPPELNVELHPHQKRALCWMAKRESKKAASVPYYDASCFGGILADDQGLGKTLTTISLMFKNPPGDDQPWCTLIVCPLSLVDQWKRELESRTIPQFKKSVHVYHGNDKAKTIEELKSFDLVISTYGTVAAEARLPQRQTLLFRFKWYRVVLDESHNVRNQRTARYKAVEKLSAQIRWALSGTPVQNSVDDIYSLLEFINFKIAASKEDWKSKWKRQLESHDNKISTLQYNKLKTILGVVMLRRTKTDTFNGKPILNLPQRVTHVLEKELMYPEEQRVYMEVLVKSVMVFNSVLSHGGIQENMSAILTKFLRMRQACFHPFLIEYCSYLRKMEQIKKGDNTHVMSNEEKQFARAVSRAQNKFCRKKATPEYDSDEDMEDAAFSDDDDFIDDRPYSELMREAEKRLKQCDRDEESGLKDAEQNVRPEPKKDELSIVDLTVEEEPALLDLDSNRDEYDDLDFGNIDVEDMWKQGEKLPNFRFEDEDDDGIGDENVVLNGREMKKKMQEALMKPSTKMDMLIEKLKQIREEDSSRKSLVFSQWTTCLDIVQRHLEKSGFECCRLDGKMRMGERQEEIKRFETTSKSVLLISLRAGGEGLNLVVASQVFLIDAWWNPAVEEQAIDRVHRIGQKRDVHIYRFKMKNTFETFVYQVSERKKNLIAGTIGGEGGSISANQPRLTMADFKTLFRGAAENLIEKGATGAALSAARGILQS